MTDKEFIEAVYEQVYGYNAINRGFSNQEVLEEIKNMDACLSPSEPEAYASTRKLIIFEGDLVRMVGEDEWLKVEEIIIETANPEDNKLRLSDGYICPAPVERYVADVMAAV